MTTSDSDASAQPPSPPDAPLVVAAFLARYLADQADGTARSCADYELLFPGYAAVIRAEYGRLQGGEAAAEEVAGERLAGYRILRELGRGGQGIVYLAEDERLARQVALKVLPGAFTATVARQRLLREAQAASRLDDPGICTVYDAGEQDGVAFIAMQFVDGHSVQARIEVERTRQDLRLAEALRIKELLGMFEAVLRSLHRAHEKGLVHRDIKPSNLMVSTDGVPMILDFGLAAFDDHPDGSLTGEVALGTPAYMSPEQLTAREGRIDARSDVFSMAVTLFEALTLQHPFEAPTRERLYQHILQDEAPPLRKLVTGLPRDLDVVLQCALSKERARRYATALAFAEDLRAVRLHEPIQARKVGALGRAARWAQRNPVVAAMLALLIAASVTFVASTAAKNQDLAAALASETEAQTKAQRALDDERAARERSDALYLVGLSSSQRQKDPELALVLAREARKLLDHNLTRSALREALQEVRVRPLVPGVAGAHWAKLSPDAARVAIAVDGEVRLHEVDSLGLVRAIACPNSRDAEVWWSGDGKRMVLAPANRVARYVAGEVFDGDVGLALHDGRTGARIAPLPGPRGKVVTVAFKDRWLLVGDAAHDFGEPRDGIVHVFQVETGTAAFSLDGNGSGVADAQFVGGERAKSFPDFEVVSRDGLYRRVQGRSGKVLSQRRVVGADEREARQLFLGRPGQVCKHDGDLFLMYDGRSDAPPVGRPVPGASFLYEPGQPLVNISMATPAIAPISPSRLLPRARISKLRAVLGDLTQLAMPAREMLYVATGRRVAMRRQLFRNTETTIFEATVLAAFRDGSMRVWSLDANRFFDVPPMGGGIAQVHTSRDGDVAAAVDGQGRVRVFDVLGSELLPEWSGSEPGSADALHPDGHLVLTCRGGGGPHADEVVLLDLRDGSKVWAVEPTSSREHVEVAWSPDGAHALAAAADGEVQLVRAADGEVLLTIPADDSDIRALQFDPSGRYFAVNRKHVELYDVRSRSLVRAFDDVPHVVTFRFAAGGERIVLAHTTSHQVRRVPDGRLLDGGLPGGGLPGGSLPKADAANRPWAVGVPCSVAGDLVLLSRMHQCRGSFVGGYGEAWVLDARSGTRTPVPGKAFGRGGLSPDGELLVLPLADGSIDVLERASGKQLRRLHGHDRAINRVLFSSDGQVFVTAWASFGMSGHRDERAICVWSRDGELLQKLQFDHVGISWLDLSHDGRWVVYKTNDGRLRRFPVHPQRLVEQLDLRDLTEAERERFEVR